MRRSHLKQITVLNARLDAIAHEARKRAAILPVGTERDELLRLAVQSENASLVAECFGCGGEKPSQLISHSERSFG